MTLVDFVNDTKNRNYDTLVHLVSAHSGLQSLSTMNDDVFKESYKYCFERHHIIHENPTGIDLRKKNNYIF